MSLKSLADIQRITKEKNKTGRKSQSLFIKAFTFYKTVNNYIRELYVYKHTGKLQTMSTKCVPFGLERLEAKSKCTDMTSTSDRSRTTEDGGFS